MGGAGVTGTAIVAIVTFTTGVTCTAFTTGISIVTCGTNIANKTNNTNFIISSCVTAQCDYLFIFLFLLCRLYIKVCVNLHCIQGLIDPPS